MLPHKFKARTTASDDYNSFKLRSLYETLDNDEYFIKLRKEVAILECISEQSLENMENIVIAKQYPGRSVEWMVNYLKQMYIKYFD